MLTQQENERLTRVGPGTPMGDLLRRYWHPVAGTSEFEGRWTQRVRLLGEDLVLYRDRSGGIGLIDEFCPHRRASMSFGIPTKDGLRCGYHGWEFNGSGTCLEQPNEPEESSFKDKVTTTAYPVQEMGGLLWAYLGPAPAPALRRIDGFVIPRAIRNIGKTVVDCNWLQIMENSMDPVHTEWLHGALYEFVKEDTGAKVAIARHHERIGFDEFEHGIIKRRLLAGQSEDSDDWKIGHPVVFPNILAVGSGGGLWKSYSFQIRVPMDDTHTMHYWYDAYVPPENADVPDRLLEDIPVFEPALKDAAGAWRLEYVDAQDIMAWVTQGPIADRTRERLGASDRGVTMFRKMLARELLNIEAGRDPISVIRGPEGDRMIELPLDVNKDMFSDGFASLFGRLVPSFSPNADAMLSVFADSGTSREGVLTG